MAISAKTTAMLTMLLLMLAPVPADAQFGGLIERATRAVTDEVGDNIEAILRDGVRCVMGDDACVAAARAEGRTPVMTDANGEVLTDDDGRPYTDPADVPPDVAAAATPASTGEAPGTGVWVNYDFVPGDVVMFYDDYMDGRVGDFPRRFELLEGNWEVVEAQDTRYVRGDGRRCGRHSATRNASRAVHHGVPGQCVAWQRFHPRQHRSDPRIRGIDPHSCVC